MTRIPFDRRNPAVGQSAPEIDLADLTGEMVNMGRLSGRVVLVNFWASWCPPCKDELRWFQKAYDSYTDRGFEIVAVVLDEADPALPREMGLTFKVVKANKRVLKSYGDISDVPVSFLVSGNGKIVKKIKGVYPEDTLFYDLKKLLGKN